MQKRCNGAKRNEIFSKCLQWICKYYAFQRNATTSNNRIMAKSHPAGMHICYAIFADISLRSCSISLRSFRITFAAYLPTHIKSLWDFFFNHYQIITGTTCISPPKLFDVGGTKPCHSFYCAGAECFLFSFSPFR